MNRFSLLILTIGITHLGAAKIDLETAPAVPANHHFNTQNDADKAIWNDIKASGLLFEKQDRTFGQMLYDFISQSDPYAGEKRKVNTLMREQFGAQQHTLTTKDGEKIATLMRRVPHARLTLIYVTGYFPNQTPTKEWVAPFYKVFPDCNIISFDWRSEGESSGTFSHNAIYDIHALLELCKTDRDLKHTKVVLNSFCLGGALALEALQPLVKENSSLMPDALVISCTPSVVASTAKKERAVGLAPNSVIRTIAKVGFMRRFMINRFLDPMIRQLTPVHALPLIRIPVCLEYCTMRDKFAPMQDAYDMYHAARNAPVRHLITSDLATHVRLHQKTPHQYREAYHQFFARAGLISPAQTAQ